MSTAITLGRILRASAADCVVGCHTDQADIPAIGDMVQIPVPQDELIFGIITNIRVADDGLVRQLVTSSGIPEAVIQDNRRNRNVPLEMEVCFIGHTRQQQISHLLPPRPPFSLDSMQLCDQPTIQQFLQAGNFGYFRHLLRDKGPIFEEILVAHILNAQVSQQSDWLAKAINELMILLRDDYDNLMKVLSALTDAGLAEQIHQGGQHAAA
jgi:hypothetical protein